MGSVGVIAGILLAFAVLVIAFVILASPASAAQTCDMQGSVSGLVLDIALAPVFSNWNVSLNAVNCHDTTGFDSLRRFIDSLGGLFSGSAAQGALVQVGGPYYIQAKVFDNQGRLLGVSPCYSFSTNVGETLKNFSFPVTVTALEKGRQLVAYTYTECSGSAPSQASFNFTV